MKKPGFLERNSSERDDGRSRMIAAGAGGLAVGAAIGAGAVLGFQYVMRGFMGIPHERATAGHPYGQPLGPEDAAFPVAGGSELAGGAAGAEEEAGRHYDRPPASDVQ
jgi:hypothetical protein